MGPFATTSSPVAGWHRRLLAAAAVFIVLLIGAGGVLCVTQSIRSCPDWPGCFGKLLPPLEASPILEITHRFLAASSGVLILAAAVTGVARPRRSAWIVLPPVIAVALLIEVSYFGAKVVLEGLTPGWAAVDVGSALLAAALMVTAAVMARQDPSARLSLHAPRAKLALAAWVAVYVVLVSGVLVAGKGSLTGCLGWPLYSRAQFRLDGSGTGDALRLLISAAAVGLMAALLVKLWQSPRKSPAAARLGRWLLAGLLLETLLQAALRIVGLKVGLLVPYTLTMAGIWGLLTALTVQLALERG